jgi:hypothetical protein
MQITILSITTLQFLLETATKWPSLRAEGAAIQSNGTNKIIL